MLLALAWRNVLRNRRRSAITISSIAIGLAAMTFMWGFIDGMNRQMIDNTTRFFAGDIQIHLKGYHDDPTLDRAFQQAGPVVRAVRDHPDVMAASARLEGKALASRDDKSRGVMVAGVAPDEEASVTVLFDAIAAGERLAASANGVLIGEALAEALGVRTGGEVVLVSQAYDGSVASGRYPVRGVFRTKIDELDNYLVIMPLAVARDFFAAPDAATSLALRLRERGDTERVRTSLASKLGERYEVLGWPVLLPMVAVGVRFHEVVTYVVLFAFLVVVGAAVANPVLMAVLERTREFGIMLAVGTSRARLLRLVLYEVALLGFAGLAIGNALGIGLTAYFSRSGIDLGAFEAGLRTMPGLSDVIYPAANASSSLAISAIVLATAGVAALYPAIGAARIEPVEAIRGRGRARGRSLRGAAPSRGPVFVLIAIRNLLRNRRRTGIMVGGAGFSILAFVFIFGFFDGFFEQTVENSTRYLTGHVQLERPGFRRDFAPQLALGEPEELIQRVRSASNVAAAAPRVQAQALASTATKSEGIMLIGIDPAAERGVTFIDRTIVQGAALAAGADREIMIGRKLAEKLRVNVGEKVVVMAQAADGELATAAYRVGGIFATESSSFDGAIAYVTLPAAQSLLALGTRVSTINIRLADRARLDRAIEALRALAAPGGLAPLPWQKLLPQLEEMIRFNRVVSDIILAVFLLVVVTAIINTVFMSVAERTHEFGVMMALGASPAAIRRMVLYETAVLMTLATIIGYTAGIALVLYFGRRGIDLSGFFRGYSAIPGLTGIVYPKLFPETIVLPGIGLLVAGVLVSLYPAARAAALEPVAAMRHV